MGVKDVICLECGFDERAGRKIAAATGETVSRNVLIFGGLGAAILAAAVFLVVVLANRGPKTGPEPPTVQTVQGGKTEVGTGTPTGNPPSQPGQPPVVVPKEDAFDINSKLTISNAEGVLHGNQLRITVQCAWTGKPNPKTYATGKYSFTPVVTEISIGGNQSLKLDKPDLREGAVEYADNYARAAFLIAPGLPLNHLAAIGGELSVRIGDSPELRLSQSSVAKGVPLMKPADPETPAPPAEWDKLRGTWKHVSHFQHGQMLDFQLLKIDSQAVIEGEKWRMIVDGKEVVGSQMKINSTRTPKTLDLITVVQGKTHAGENIYKIDGDMLTVAMPGITGGGRPDTFELSPYVQVSVYRRAANAPLPNPVDPPLPPLPKGEIAFCSDRDGSMEIYRMELGGTAATRLTNGGGVNPSWSPDGARIAFERPLKGKSQIFTMDADGSKLAKLSDSEGHRPAWSPDGQHIVFEGPFALMRVPSAGGRTVNVTKGLWNDDDPAWTPDSKQLIYTSPQAAGLDVKKTKDGVAIGGGSNRQLFAVPAEGGAPVQITPTAARQFCQPAVSPDGKQIAAVALPPGNVIDAYEDIWLMSRDGKDPRNLTNTPKGFNHSPDWSQDGKWLVFCSKRDGNFEVYAMPVAGGAAHRLTNHPGNDSAPRWRTGSP